MPETLCWYQSTHGTWLADGTHQTLFLSPLAFKFVSHCGTNNCIAVEGVCRQDVRTRLMTSASFLALKVGRHCAPYRQTDLSLVTARWPGRTYCVQGVKQNRWTWLEQRPPWQPNFLLHFTCVSAHAIRFVRYIPIIGRESISVNHYAVGRTENLVTNTRLLKVLGFW